MAILLAGCASHSISRAERRAEENEAHSAALHWLQLLDDGDYEHAFEFEAQDFRMFRTQGQFVRLMQARRAPFAELCLDQLSGRGGSRNSSAHRKGITTGSFLRPRLNTRIRPPSAPS